MSMRSDRMLVVGRVDTSLTETSRVGTVVVVDNTIGLGLLVVSVE